VLGVVFSRSTRNPDFQALKRRGIQFVFIKASQGASSLEEAAKQNAEKARANGIKVGLYHFFTYDADVQAQFANFSKALQDIPFDLPPTLDCEWDFSKGREQKPPPDYAARVSEMASKLEQSYKRKVIIYTAASFAGQNLGPQESGQYLFIADFSRQAGAALKPAIPKWWADYTFWHLAESVSDDDVLKGYDIIGFKGNSEQLNGL
jgi:lysozyme